MFDIEDLEKRIKVQKEKIAAMEKELKEKREKQSVDASRTTLVLALVDYLKDSGVLSYGSNEMSDEEIEKAVEMFKNAEDNFRKCAKIMKIFEELDGEEDDDDDYSPIAKITLSNVDSLDKKLDDLVQRLLK